MRNEDRVSSELGQRLRAKGYKGGLSFTELWGAMPSKYRPSDEVNDYFKILDKDCRVGYYCGDTASWLGHNTFSHESPAECAAMMLEWLLDNGHIKSEVE